MVLLDYNAVGNDKLFPLVIGKSENPHCFKYISESCPQNVWQK